MLKLIVAIGKNNEMGMGSGLLEHFSEDLKHFKRTTRGHIVVVGRNTFDGFPEHMKEFPSRYGIVITSRPRELDNYINKKVVTVPSLDTVLDIYEQDLEQHGLNEEQHIFISGGARVYAEALESGKIEEMIITHINKDYPDATHYFPKFDESKWEVFKVEELTDELTIKHYRRA